MALGLFLGITGLSTLIVMVCAYAGCGCFGERDSIPKRIKDEEQTEESGNYGTDGELELLGGASEATESDHSFERIVPSEIPTEELDKKDEVSLPGSQE
jgi:hypothetical protein